MAGIQLIHSHTSTTHCPGLRVSGLLLSCWRVAVCAVQLVQVELRMNSLYTVCGQQHGEWY
jgi:hypothetical protein